MKPYDSSKRLGECCGHGCCFLDEHPASSGKKKDRRTQKKRQRRANKFLCIEVER